MGSKSSALVALSSYGCCQIVAPSACRYGADGWEVVFGYDQEKMMGERAGAALVLDLKDVDQKQSTPAMSMT